jgi:hypothetical protein
MCLVKIGSYLEPLYSHNRNLYVGLRMYFIEDSKICINVAVNLLYTDRTLPWF